MCWPRPRRSLSIIPPGYPRGTGGAIAMTTCHVSYVHRDPEEAIVLAAGLRTPQVRAGGAFAGEDAGHLGSALSRELLVRHGLDGGELDEVLFGCAIPPHDAPNVARVIALRAGLPASVPARTVGRSGGSGMEAVTAAITSIRAGQAKACLCGGVENMSAYPLLMGPELTSLFGRLSRTGSIHAALEAWSAFRPGWLKPRSVGLERMRDPFTGVSRGAAAEALAEEFGVSREAADTFALRSHTRAARARDAGHFQEEIFPWLPLGARDGSRALQHDEGIRDGLSLDALAELEPRFVTPDGTVTAGNSAGNGDGATALLVATEARAAELCLEPLARIRAYAWVGLEPARGGLAPVFAAARVLERVLAGAEPTTATARLPMLTIGEVTSTDGPVLSGVFQQVREMERRDDVLSAAVLMTQPYLDAPDVGWVILAVTDGKPALARELSERLADLCWATRDRLRMDFLDAAQSVSEALTIEGRPVILADGADATNSGAGGDSVHLLRELTRRPIPGGALTIMVDPQAVAHARARGAGAQFEFAVGGKRDAVFSRPLPVRGEVLFIRPGRYVLSGHGGDNLPIDMGDTAAVRIADVTLLLVERPGPGSTPLMYRCVGLEPKEFKIVVVKSPAGFRAEFGPFASGIVLSACPGCATARLEDLPYTKLSRPIWPMDDIDDWRNVDWVREAGVFDPE